MGSNTFSASPDGIIVWLLLAPSIELRVLDLKEKKKSIKYWILYIHHQSQNYQIDNENQIQKYVLFPIYLLYKSVIDLDVWCIFDCATQKKEYKNGKILQKDPSFNFQGFYYKGMYSAISI